MPQSVTRERVSKSTDGGGADRRKKYVPFNTCGSAFQPQITLVRRKQCKKGCNIQVGGRDSDDDIQCPPPAPAHSPFMPPFCCGIFEKTLRPVFKEPLIFPLFPFLSYLPPARIIYSVRLLDQVLPSPSCLYLSADTIPPAWKIILLISSNSGLIHP